ncbi:MAG: CotH kinase family protein [Candidatus Limivicinus sp.]
MGKKAKWILPALMAAVLIAAGCRQAPEATPSPAPAVTPAPTLSPEELNRGLGQLVISEFMEKNRAVLRDEDGDFSDWIELYNQSGETVSLSGCTISDKENKLGWALPETELEPGQRLLLFASGKDRQGEELHTDFALSGDEGVYLRNEQGTLLSAAACGGCEADVAMVLQADGSYAQSLYPTPGFENSRAGYGAFQQGLACDSPLVINEVVVYNSSTLPMKEKYYDWVELKNVSSQPVLLSDYCLSDRQDELMRYRLPELTLQPGALWVVFCTQEPSIPGFMESTGFGLDGGNEQLYLSDGQGQLLDYVSLRDIPYNASYGRQEGENGWFFFASASPGTENTGGGRTVAEKPVSLTKDGVFNGVDGMDVELSATGSIRYTLDGSAPTADSAEYTGPIHIDKTTVIRAVNLEEGALASRPLSLSFILNENHSLPVLSLLTDSPGDFELVYNARQKGIELPASLSLYDGREGFTMGCGVSLNGETSLVLPKKNMSVRFRDTYGQATLSYDIYGGGVTEFTNLLLRSGQDFPRSIIRNELCQELCAQATDKVVNQRSQYCVLYINGVYSGIYSLKEKTNEQLYASLAGVSRDSVTVMEADVPQDSAFFHEVVEFCRFNDMSLPENYQHFCDIFDVDSLIDWLVLEGYCANTDVSSGNVRYCRSTENDGKWRMMFYDLDATFSEPASVYLNLMSQYAQENRQVSVFVVPLMANQEFKDRFLTRAAELMGSVLTVENVFAEIDRLCAIVQPEVARDCGRFNRTEREWENAVEEMKQVLLDYDWQKLNIDNLCRLFDLDQAQREQYFGEIEKGQ